VTLRDGSIAAVGALVGTAACGIAGALIGIGYADRFVSPEGFERLGAYFMGVIAGAWFGTGFGTWVALRIFRRAAALSTGVATVVLAPVAALLAFLVTRLDGASSTTLGNIAGVVLLLGIAGAAAGARALVAVASRRGRVVSR
jgi:hypothetical protein